MASLEEISARVRAASGPTQCRYDGTLPTEVPSSYNTPEARAHCHTGLTNVHSDGPRTKTEILGGLGRTLDQASSQSSHASSGMPGPAVSSADCAIASFLATPEQIERVKRETAEIREKTQRMIQEGEAYRQQAQTARICSELEKLSGMARQPERQADVPNTGLAQEISDLFAVKKDVAIPEEINTLIANLENVLPEKRVHFLVAQSFDCLFPQTRKIFGEKLGEPKSMASYQPLLGAIVNNPKYKPFVGNVLAVVPTQYHQGLLNTVANYNARNAYHIRKAYMKSM